MIFIYIYSYTHFHYPIYVAIERNCPIHYKLIASCFDGMTSKFLHGV